MEKPKITDTCHRGGGPAGRFARNALWLISVSLLMRAVSVSFNVYLSNRAGSEVMGLHALLMGVYGLAITLGCGGVHLGTTRLIAEALGCYPDGSALQHDALVRCMKRCLCYATLCGAVASLLFFVAAPWVGRVWLGDERTVPSLRILALTLLPIALGSCLSGYFTGMRRVGISSVAGFVTHLVRLALCVCLVEAALPDGIEASCRALILGGAISEGLGLLLSFLAFHSDRKKHGRDAVSASDPVTPACNRTPSSLCRMDGTHLTGRLLHITVPVTLAACLRSGLVTLEHALIPRGLQAGGSDWGAALSSYGILHGVVLPVVLFPSAFISAFSGLLVPEVAECRAAGQSKRVARIAQRVVTPALIFSFGVAGLMACFARELGVLVCGSEEAGGYIRALAPLIPIMYVDSAVDGILKGMGEQVYSMVVNIIDALTSVLLVWWLLPRMGLNGFILTIYVTETLNTTLSLCRMLFVSRMKISLWRMVFGPLLCIIAATWGTRGLCHLLPPMSDVPGLIICITVGALLYLGLLLLLGVVRRDAAAGVIRAIRGKA